MFNISNMFSMSGIAFALADYIPPELAFSNVTVSDSSRILDKRVIQN